MLEHKEAIISHLSWVSLFLGFHTLGLYVHNDVVVAFGTPEKQILVEPVFAQFVQAASGKAIYGFDVLLANAGGAAANANAAYMGGWMDAIKVFVAATTCSCRLALVTSLFTMPSL